MKDENYLQYACSLLWRGRLPSIILNNMIKIPTPYEKRVNIFTDANEVRLPYVINVDDYVW